MCLVFVVLMVACSTFIDIHMYIGYFPVMKTWVLTIRIFRFLKLLPFSGCLRLYGRLHKVGYLLLDCLVVQSLQRQLLLLSKIYSRIC
jgi:hypothetical protein